jgi:hypothetical protein
MVKLNHSFYLIHYIHYINTFINQNQTYNNHQIKHTIIIKSQTHTHTYLLATELIIIATATALGR